MLGIAALVAFALLSAARDVWAKHLFKGTTVDADTLTFLLLVVSASTLYVVASARQGRAYDFRELWNETPEVKRTIFWLNGCTLIAYVTTFLAIKQVDAYMNSIVDYGASPMIIAMLAVVLRGDRIAPLGILGMTASTIGIMVVVAGYKTNAPGLDSLPFAGLAYAFCSALFASVGHVLNKNLVESGVTRERALLVRMPLPIVALGIWVFATGGLPPNVPWVQISVLAIFGLTIPVYLVVFALERVQVQSLAVSLFLIPVFAYVGSVLLGHVGLSAVHAIAGFVVLAGVVVSERAAAPPAAASQESAPA